MLKRQSAKVRASSDGAEIDRLGEEATAATSQLLRFNPVADDGTDAVAAARKLHGQRARCLAHKRLEEE